MEFLSIEWNLIRLGGPAHGLALDQNCTQNSARRWRGGGDGV